MYIAACWSITAARLARLTSLPINSRSTAAVDSRSSHSPIGSSVSLAKLRAKARVEHEADGVAFGGERQHAGGVLGEVGPRDGLDAGGELAVGIANGDADRLGAEVEANERPARRQQVGDVDQRQDQGHARSGSTRPE
jgi:hypothetical protein